MALLFASAPANAKTPVRLRVLSWNVWGLPTVSAYMPERMRALPDAIASFAPDVVVLQELWEEQEGAKLARGLGRHGYAYTEHLVKTPAGKTGLFIASRRALTRAEFHPFTFGRTPHTLWHLDWMASKGVGRWIVATPLGGVVIANTHLQAQYATDTYDAERLSQAIEILLSHRDPQNRPTIIAGDFNSDPGDVPRTTLGDLGRLTDASDAPSPDTVFVRNGTGLSIRVLEAREVLTEHYALDNGERAPLSDHAAVLVDVELAACNDCGAQHLPNDQARKEALSALQTAAASTPNRVSLALLAALAIAAAASRFRQLSRWLAWSPGRALTLQVLGFALMAVGFAWSAYVGIIYYPARGEALRNVAAEFERAR